MKYYKKDGFIIASDLDLDLPTATQEEWQTQCEPTEYEKAQERIAELKQMLADADYWTSKRMDGEYTDEEWAEKVAIRKAWRAEINELELVVDNQAVSD